MMIHETTTHLRLRWVDECLLILQIAFHKCVDGHFFHYSTLAVDI